MVPSYAHKRLAELSPEMHEPYLDCSLSSKAAELSIVMVGLQPGKT